MFVDPFGLCKQGVNRGEMIEGGLIAGGGIAGLTVLTLANPPTGLVGWGLATIGAAGSGAAIGWGIPKVIAGATGNEIPWSSTTEAVVTNTVPNANVRNAVMGCHAIANIAIGGVQKTTPGRINSLISNTNTAIQSGRSIYYEVMR